MACSVVKGKLEMTVYQNYLKDLGVLLKEMALEAKQDAATKKTEFSIGYMAGFHRVVSLMQQQAESFNISLKEIGLDDFDPDEDLV